MYLYRKTDRGMSTLFNSFLILFFWSQVSSAAERINFWEHSPKEEQDVFDLLIKDFESANKDIKIKRSHFKTEDLRPQFQTAALGGGGADLVLAPNDFAGPFAVMGLIKPVQKLIKSELFLGPAIEAVTSESGDIWGIPLSSGNHLLLFVNKKLMPKLPGTLEEIVVLAKKISDPKTKKYGLAYNQNEPFWFMPFYLGFGGQALEKDKPSLGNDAMVNALTLVESLKNKDKISPKDCDYTCAETLFVEGKAALTINGDWAIQKFEGALGADLGVEPLPLLAASGKRMIPYVSGKYLYFNSRSRASKFEASRKFADFLLLPANQVKLSLAAGRLPALKSAMEQPEIAKQPLLMASYEAMKLGTPMPMAVEMRAVWDAIRPQLQAVLASVADPKAAAQQIQKLAELEVAKIEKNKKEVSKINKK